MSSLIPITQVQATSQPNVFTYRFPTGNANFKDNQVAVQSVILPYNWYNITSTYGNNTGLSLVFPVTDGTSTSTISVTIPNGFYTITQLNELLQSKMITAGKYLVDGSGNNVYYWEIVANTSTGLAQINAYVVPNSLPSGYTNPASWTLPSTGTRVPQYVQTNQAFGNVIGFINGSYPASTTQTSTYSVQSSQQPQISPVSSILMTCSLVFNNLSSPNNIVATIPINATYGSQIVYEPREYIWMRCLEGNVSAMSISFVDQNGNAIALLDSNINASILLR